MRVLSVFAGARRNGVAAIAIAADTMVAFDHKTALRGYEVARG